VKANLFLIVCRVDERTMVNHITSRLLWSYNKGENIFLLYYYLQIFKMLQVSYSVNSFILLITM